MISEYISNSVKETKKIGKILAKSLKEGVLICLIGDLGGGKTTFSQGFAEGVGIKEKITSPTFVLMKKYKITNQDLNYLYHFDCYRLRKPEEILALGWEDITEDKNNIILVEWAEKIEKYLPKERIEIRFEVVGEGERRLVIQCNGKWDSKERVTGNE